VEGWDSHADTYYSVESVEIERDGGGREGKRRTHGDARAEYFKALMAISDYCIILSYTV